MAYNEDYAFRLREALSHRSDVVEKKMFGGLTFMVSGHMCVGTSGDTLLVRVGADNYEESIKLPHARPMDFTGRPMKGFVRVDKAGFASQDDLQSWVQRALDFVTTLPPK